MDLVLDSSWGAAKRKLGTQTETNNRTGYVSYLKSQATFIIIIIQYMLWERGHWDSSHMAIFCVFIVILKPIGQFCCAPLSAALFCVFLSSYTDVKADWCSQWTSLYSWWHCYIALLLCCSVHRLVYDLSLQHMRLFACSYSVYTLLPVTWIEIALPVFYNMSLFPDSTWEIS